MTVPTLRLAALLLVGTSAEPLLAQAAADPAEVKRQLEELRAMRQSLDRQMGEFDRRIGDLERQLDPGAPAIAAAPAGGRAAAAPPALAAPVVTAGAASATTSSSAPLQTAEVPAKPVLSDFVPGKGFVLASGQNGELAFSGWSYVRYLNQLGLDDSYTDAFGRTSTIDKRHDLQLNKVSLQFKGWMLDERLRYLWFIWTQNTSQGDGAQVAIAGNLSFRFSSALTIAGGLGAVPTTRSTSYNHPHWLRQDNRTMADEFFRGSFTTGIWAYGDLTPKLSYFAMLGNNLSQLGINAPQLDNGINTFGARLHWKPSTGEFGYANEFGDYSFHERVATMFGVHFTHSQEDAQGQSGPESFENSQLRLSDGTLIFRKDPFGTGGDVRQVDYDMLDLNAGVKYRGFSLEYEHYFRWLSNFKTNGPIPVDGLFDHGFQVQASAMLVPKQLQIYGTASKIWGEYGDPDEFALGVNWFPFARREFRIASQLLRLNGSPIGYASVPATVGGRGWVFTTDVLLAF